jgi:PAS domain S-box-containing protein
LGSLPLFLAVGIAEDDYLADWRKETRALGGLSLLFFLATTLSAWLFYRSWHHRETYTQSLERAKEEIEAERQLNASLLTSAGEGICGTDAQGNLTFVNPAAKQMLGWMDADPVGQSLHHLVHHHRPDGSDYPIDDCPTHKTLKDGTPRHVGAEAYWRKDGSSFPVEFTSTAICHNAQVIGSVTVFRDISASQETERRLRFFKEVLNRAKDPVLCIDPQDGFRVILANPAAEAHFGVSMEQLLTMRIPEWAPQFSEADYRDMEARLAADNTIVFETEHHTANGLVPVEINLTAADVDGHLYWIAIVRDISERKRIEATLRTSAELARALMNASSDAAFLMDLDGIVLSANETMAARLQTSVEALIGQSFFKWIPADLAMIRQSLCQDVIRSGQPSHGHDERDGLILDNRIYPVHDAKGEIYQLAVFSRDVTEQSRQEQEIRQLLSYQRAILGNAPIGIAIFDQDRKFIEANPAFLDIFGWTGEDLQGQSARLLYSDDESFQATGAHAYPIIRESQSFRGDALMRTRDRGEIWVRLTGRLVDAVNPKLGVIWATEDITERKALELDLKRSNEELERFAYVASHDLRQPLRVINGYLDLIEKTLGTELSEELRTFIDFALDGGKRMDRMIVDLLDYSRIGRNTAGKEPVDLNKVLACAIGNLELLIEDTQGDVVIPALLPTLPGYESELERLFQNLISNAIKFRSADRSPKVKITCRKTSREWIIAISDNGIGIAPNDHNRLFQIFQRLVAREQYEGNGIGLAACRKIMEHHAGRIWLESELGTGSTFQVALPVR